MLSHLSRRFHRTEDLNPPESTRQLQFKLITETKCVKILINYNRDEIYLKTYQGKNKKSL
jgi:hypothetical protein